MIKVEKINISGIDTAVRAMRNPMNSWEKSDSNWVHAGKDESGIDIFVFDIGQKDLELMKRLYASGTEHRTYARIMNMSMDITAPLYWWKEMDRYTVGKSQVSTSTMHKIHAKEFSLDNFSHDGLSNLDLDAPISENYWDVVIGTLNHFRNRYLETRDPIYWRQLIELLPSSYNQKRTVSMSYEVVFKIIKERSHHKLIEWVDFVNILKEQPYVTEIIGDETHS